MDYYDVSIDQRVAFKLMSLTKLAAQRQRSSASYGADVLLRHAWLWHSEWLRSSSILSRRIAQSRCCGMTCYGVDITQRAAPELVSHTVVCMETAICRGVSMA